MLGEKTKRLQTLVRAGFNVPSFVAIASGDIDRDSSELAERATDELKGQLFAVRSSALVEDAAKSSMAGQFMTRLAVPRADLSRAIDEVRSDAQAKLGSLQDFSIIIQEFIEPDYSGVAFTRNPSGDRDLVLEYHRGRGDVVVGGEVKPVRESFHRAQTDLKSQLPEIDKLRTQFLAIEKLFGFPQDIEWCLRGNDLFILQSRPITSLSDMIIEVLDQLEQTLPTGKFYFAKTEVCDVAPRPSTATFELLQAMYAAGGPVHRAYETLGIKYVDTKFLRVIAGELYIDKEKELQSLFPSHSYFFGVDYRPRPVRLKGFLTSLKNTKRLQSLGGTIDVLRDQLKERLEVPFTKVSAKVARQAFFEDYQLIFTINLLAQQALDKLKRSLPTSTSLSQVLTYFPKDLAKPWSPSRGLVGNTFEFSDCTKFVSVLGGVRSTAVPGDIPLAELKLAQEYLRLREYGRWLALRHIGRLRELVAEIDMPSSSSYSLPTTLTDRPLPLDTKHPMGVSSGQATGKLVSKPEVGGILVVSALTPDIANHVDLLKGVIADHGGLLSHFAIIARELGLPVIANYPIHELNIGDIVTIDGATGEVIID